MYYFSIISNLSDIYGLVTLVTVREPVTSVTVDRKSNDQSYLDVAKDVKFLQDFFTVQIRTFENIIENGKLFHVLNVAEKALNFGHFHVHSL